MSDRHPQIASQHTSGIAGGSFALYRYAWRFS